MVSYCVMQCPGRLPRCLARRVRPRPENPDVQSTRDTGRERPQRCCSSGTDLGAARRRCRGPGHRPRPPGAARLPQGRQGPGPGAPGSIGRADRCLPGRPIRRRPAAGPVCHRHRGANVPNRGPRPAVPPRPARGAARRPGRESIPALDAARLATLNPDAGPRLAPYHPPLRQQPRQPGPFPGYCLPGTSAAPAELPQCAAGM